MPGIIILIPLAAIAASVVTLLVGFSFRIAAIVFFLTAPACTLVVMIVLKLKERSRPR